MNLSLEKKSTVALIGNPNCGKTTIFNLLTGLNQKTGNFPGVTVDKKTGTIPLPNGESIQLIDLPGTYSLYPNSKDERIAVNTLTNPNDTAYPDLIVYVADVMSLERHLLLLSQIIDLEIPIVLLLNMADLAEKEQLNVDNQKLSQLLQIPVISVSGRTGFNIDLVKKIVEKELKQANIRPRFYKTTEKEKALIQSIRQNKDLTEFNRDKYTNHHLLLIAHNHEWLAYLTEEQRNQIASIMKAAKFDSLRSQINETMNRFATFTPFVKQTKKRISTNKQSFTDRIDAIVTNRILGPIIFFALMLFVFQAIYAWSSLPMDMIEGFFATLSEYSRIILPEGWISDLVADGILAGLGGVLVFIPQIAILFFLISILEQVGYMARAVFMFDGLMQRFGLNGRSIVALISGGACAIPAIMSTRTISNAKERLITILVTPWISCSARIPVYTILIGFVVPETSSFMGFNAQGLAFMALYILGIVATLIAALVFKYILKSDERSFLMIELPQYQAPIARNILYSVYEKVKTFTLEAGKVILIVSIVLWFLANFSFPGQMYLAEQEAIEFAQVSGFDDAKTADLVASKKLETSFAGKFGKTIEPIIRPLGFDWKIGIALLTSFAAREVFVGTMATIYSIGSTDDELTIRERMAQEINPLTNEPVFTMATALSLLIFYVFAMQCMGTLAVVYRETKSWKWPIVQFVYMTVVAYLGSLLVFQILG